MKAEKGLGEKREEKAREVEGKESFIEKGERSLEIFAGEALKNIGEAVLDFKETSEERLAHIGEVVSLGKDALREIQNELSILSLYDDLFKRMNDLADATRKRIKILLFSPVSRLQSEIDIFNPQQELQDLKKLTGSEKKESLILFKEKLLEQRRGLVHVHTAVIEAIRKNPNLTFEDIEYDLGYLKDKYRISDDVWRERVESVVREYQKKHRAVKEIRESHPDDRELFLTLFGAFPKGNVEIIQGSVTLMVRCHLEDYALINSGAFLENQKVSSNDVHRARLSGGVSLSGALQEDLRGTIIVEKFAVVPRWSRKSRAIYAHEEQHAIHRLFQQKLRNEMADSLLHKINRKEARGDLSVHEMLKITFETERLRAENSAADEILAYIRDQRFADILSVVSGTQYSNIFYLLIKKESEGGLYDYFHGFTLPKEPWFEEMSDEVKEEMRTQIFEKDYQKHLWLGLSAVRSLRGAGYSIDDVIALLTYEPLAKWPKVVRRFLAK